MMINMLKWSELSDYLSVNKYHLSEFEFDLIIKKSVEIALKNKYYHDFKYMNDFDCLIKHFNKENVKYKKIINKKINSLFNVIKNYNLEMKQESEKFLILNGKKIENVTELNDKNPFFVILSYSFIFYFFRSVMDNDFDNKSIDENPLYTISKLKNRTISFKENLGNINTFVSLDFANLCFYHCDLITQSINYILNCGLEKNIQENASLIHLKMPLNCKKIVEDIFTYVDENKEYILNDENKTIVNQMIKKTNEIIFVFLSIPPHLRDYNNKNKMNANEMLEKALNEHLEIIKKSINEIHKKELDKKLVDMSVHLRYLKNIKIFF